MKTEKMAADAQAGPEKAVDMERLGGALERFSGAGMALLPWTRHMITALWDQLRLLVQIIYYTLTSVFQMFRFEVHVRITDDPSVTSDPSDPFLFSSLFEEGRADHTDALLSTLRGEELHCDGEGGIFIGHKRPSSWSVGDWSFFVSSEGRSSDEERSASCWSSEEEHLEFDCEESKALWESLSRSGDPYDPFCFSACVSTRSKASWDTPSSKASWERESSPEIMRSITEESFSPAPHCDITEESFSPAPHCDITEESFSPVSDLEEESWEAESELQVPPVGRFWNNSSEESEDEEERLRGNGLGTLVQRSNSSSSWSSDSSDSSDSSELQEENQQLWDLFLNQDDPFNPLCFSASSRRAQELQQQQEDEEKEEEEQLWKGLNKEQDPYHPLNFTALELRERGRRDRGGGLRKEEEESKPHRRRGVRPTLTQRRPRRHGHSQVRLRPWTKAPPPTRTSTEAPPPAEERQTQKKVRFSAEVRVHVPRSWSFARRAARKGPWEELARDRDRFRRRIQDLERSLGPVLDREHRDRIWTRTHADPGLRPNPDPEPSQD